MKNNQKTCEWCHLGKYDPETDTITCEATNSIVDENDSCDSFVDFEDYM